MNKLLQHNACTAEMTKLFVVKGNKGGTDSTNAQLPFGVFVEYYNL